MCIYIYIYIDTHICIYMCRPGRAELDRPRRVARRADALPAGRDVLPHRDRI